MKRPESARLKPERVIWDEPNLEANEKIKAQFSNVHVDEPKTPYRSPLKDADMDADEEGPMELLELEPAHPSGTGGTGSGALSEAVMAPAAAHQDVSATATADIGAMEVDQDEEDPGPGPGDSRKRSGWSSDGSQSEHDDGQAGAAGDATHDKFEQNRKAHYNMADALRQARALMTAEDEEDEEEDEQAPAGSSAPVHA